MRPWLILAVIMTVGCTGDLLSSFSNNSQDENDFNASTTAGATAGGVNASPSPASTGTDGNSQMMSPTPSPSASPAVFNCNTTKFPVCDGFELMPVGGPPDPNRWNSNVTLPPPGDSGVHSVHPTEDSIVISDKYSHTGSQSLLFHTVGDWEHIPIQDITSAIYPQPFLPAPNNTFFVRFWVYHDATSFVPGSGHWYMVNASGPLAGRQQYQKMGGGGPNLGWNYWGDDSGIGSSTAWPLGAWNCFEVEFKGDTAELHVWQNDLAVTDMTAAAGHWAAPDYNRLTIGWEMDHPDTAYPGADVYVDDVAYSYSRIYCAP